MRNVDLSTFRDPEPDEKRTKDPRWLIVLGICTHLGCVPIPNKGNFKFQDLFTWPEESVSREENTLKIWLRESLRTIYAFYWHPFSLVGSWWAANIVLSILVYSITLLCMLVIGSNNSKIAQRWYAWCGFVFTSLLEWTPFFTQRAPRINHSNSGGFLLDLLFKIDVVLCITITWFKTCIILQETIPVATSARVTVRTTMPLVASPMARRLWTYQSRVTNS